MIKTLSAIAIAAFMAAALTILPGFAPQVEASVPMRSPRPTGSTSARVGTIARSRHWPNFEATCLRAAGTKTAIREARW